MSIKARGKGFEATVVKDKQRYRKTLKTYEEAQAWEAKVQLALLEGRTPDNITSSGGAWNLLQAADATFEAIWENSKSEKTMMLNSGSCVDFFGKNKSLSAITTLEIQAWVGHLKGLGNSNGTINRKLAALSRILSYAKQCGKLDAVPHIPRQKEPKGRLRWLTEAEEQQILTTCKLWSNQDLHDIVVVLLDTGVRIGELLKLNFEDVREDRIVLIDTKNGKTHAVPLTKRAKGVFERRRKTRDWKFPFSDDYHAYQYDLQRVLEHNGIEGVSFHTLRHTFASRLVQKGVPLQTVSGLLNHSSLTMTMRYAHLSPLNYSDAIAVLEGK